ncbi:tyrosine-protein phosphatase non-receptor type 23-like [Lytechinus variegatus]|uniref:tyrosine-protein phosphatase non-receptor type 23-like n=1 Tax=Lytechinus variegatus TaxID=7654 RepID=UPI001BB1C497|nr:tyrosine-protein phosphatase non-receptor type 23-like [Lytechinus variegatus]
MYDEAFHKPLKDYLDGEGKEGEIYDLVAFLVKTADEHSDQPLLQGCLQPTQSSGRRSTHEEALQIPAECVTRVLANLYSVKTETGLLHVKRVKKSCQDTSCSPPCLEAPCLELCAHLYTCICSEESQLCHHIHRVHMQMQNSFLVNIKKQLTDPTHKSNASSAPPPPPQQKLRRSPRQAKKEAVIQAQREAVNQAQESIPNSNESEGTRENNIDGVASEGVTAGDGGDDDDEDDDDDDDDGGLFMADTHESDDDDNDKQDPGLIYNAEPVPMEDEETSTVNLRKILDVNDELLALLESKQIQASMFPYILGELKSIVAKCKAQVPAESIDGLRRRAKRKAAIPLSLLQIKMRGTAIKKAVESKISSLQESSVEQVRLSDDQVEEAPVTKAEATLPPAPSIATNSSKSSAALQDLFSFVITSSAQTQPGNAVYMVPATTNTTLPSFCDGMNPPRENSPVQIIMNAPATPHIQTIHTASSTLGMSESSPLEADAMQPSFPPLHQQQRHLFPPATVPPSMTDFSALSSQLVSSLPPVLSSATQHHSYQESEYIPRQSSLTPTGSVMSQTLVTQIVPRAAPSPYPYKEHSQLLPLTGTNQQTGATASYLASQLGHHMMQPQPLPQHLPSPYTLPGPGQPLSHQPTHPIPQPRQYLPTPNQTSQPTPSACPIYVNHPAPPSFDPCSTHFSGSTVASDGS